MHYDGQSIRFISQTRLWIIVHKGVFKTKTTPDGTIVDDPPQFQLFQCLHAPEHSEGGQTILTNTVHLLRDGLTPAQREWLAEKTWSVYTAKNEVFGGDHLRKLPFIIKNEGNGHDVLRWHEPWFVISIFTC